MNTRVGIPTTFCGVRFRSRHESRWAALFNAVGWPWEYEPIDLKRYIPDFLLRFSTGPLLVEVKPTDEDIGIAKSKIEDSGWDGEALIVVSGAASDIGVFLERDEHAFIWSDAQLFYCISCDSASVHSSSGNWRCRVCGVGGDNSHVGIYPTAEAWVEAGNRVQWRAT